MFKSFEPYTPAAIYPDLAGAYQRSAFAGVSKPHTHSSISANDEARSEEGISTFELEPGKLSFKQRIMNLIQQNQPDKALDMMVALSYTEPEKYESMADDIYAAFWREGFDSHAEKLADHEVSIAPEKPAPGTPEAAQKIYVSAPSI